MCSHGRFKEWCGVKAGGTAATGPGEKAQLSAAAFYRALRAKHRALLEALGQDD